MKIAVCDDSREFVIQFSELLRERLEPGDLVTEFSSGVELMAAWERSRFDVLFLDIEMPGMNGLDVAVEIRRMDGEVIIVAVTSYRQYALAGYDYEFLHYLVKPVETGRLAELLGRIRRKLALRRTLLIKTAKEVIRVPCERIVYIESFRRKLIVHSLDGVFQYYEKISRVSAELEGYGFFLIHRSALINLGHIARVNVKERTAAMTNGDMLTVSGDRMQELLKALSRRDLEY